MVRSSNCSASFTKSSTAWRTFFSTSSFTSFPIICSVTLMFSYTEIFAFSFARRSPNISSSDSLNSISAPIITASAVMSIDACCKICCPPAVECSVPATENINKVHNRYIPTPPATSGRTAPQHQSPLLSDAPSRCLPSTL